MTPRRKRNDILPGTLWRRRALGSEAIYEVVADHGETVEVVVRVAPGLTPGSTVRLTRNTLLALEAITAVDVPAQAPPRHSALRGWPASG